MNLERENSSHGRRSGGRAARKALRLAPLSKDLKPVHPGMIGGSYNPLKESDVVKIHNAALDALENIGLADAPETGQRTLIKAGAILGDIGGRYVVYCCQRHNSLWSES